MSRRQDVDILLNLIWSHTRLVFSSVVRSAFYAAHGIVADPSAVKCVHVCAKLSLSPPATDNPQHY